MGSTSGLLGLVLAAVHLGLAAPVSTAPAEPAAHAASHVQVTQGSGQVQAVLAGEGASGNVATLDTVRALTLGIVRDGAPLRPPTALTHCAHDCVTAGLVGFARLRVTDLDGDGEPEVVVDRSDGFDLCCTEETAILHYTAGRYVEVDAQLGSQYRLAAPAPGHGHSRRLAGDDVRLYDRFAPVVEGPFLPARIWQLHTGRIRDVTRTAGRDLVARQLRSFLRTRALLESETRHGQLASREVAREALVALVAAISADELSLGRPGAAARAISREVRAGRLGPRLAADIRRGLDELGYRGVNGSPDPLAA